MFYLSLIKRGFLVLCLLSLLFIDAHSTTSAKMVKKQVNFQKVREKTYDRPMGAIAFAETIIDGKHKTYPKVIVIGHEVQFLDQNGEVVSQKPLPGREYIEPGKFRGRTAILSKKGNFVAIHDYVGKDGEPDYFVEEKYTICNDRGEEIYRAKIPVEETTTGDQFLISDDDGSAVGTRIAYGALDFYSPDGGIKTVPLFGELGWGKRQGYATFSGDGEYVAILVREAAEPKGTLPSLKADLWIMLFNKSGKELWRRKVKECRYGNIAISEHAEYLFFKAFSIERATSPKKGMILQRKGGVDVLTSTTLSLYDKEGYELSFKDTSLFAFGGFCFSPQADYVALTGHHIIRLIRIEDESIVFEKKLPEDVAITQSLFSSDGEYLVLRVKVPIGKEKITFRDTPERQYRPVYTQRVFMFNLKGDEIWENDFADLREIFCEKRSLVLLFANRYEIYEED